MNEFYEHGVFMNDLSMIIFGRVQGVYFRKLTQQQAQRLNITGWVRNRSEGSVEILAQGDEQYLISLLEWCRRGPRFAKVEQIEINWVEQTENFSSFEIRETT